MDLLPSIDEIKVTEELVTSLEVVKCSVQALSSNKCHITMADTIYQFIMKDLTNPKTKIAEQLQKSISIRFYEREINIF